MQHNKQNTEKEKQLRNTTSPQQSNSRSSGTAEMKFLKQVSVRTFHDHAGLCSNAVCNGLNIINLEQRHQ